MLRLAMVVTTALLIGTSALQVAAQPAAVLDELTGEWEGEGTLFGRDASFHMAWTWILDREFLQLTFRNGLNTPEGVNPVLEALAVYRPVPDGTLEGTWYDTRGVVQPLRGQTNSSTLTVHWGGPDTEEGRTVYRVLDGDRVEVSDFVKKDGAWVPFGTAEYRRGTQP